MWAKSPSSCATPMMQQKQKQNRDRSSFLIDFQLAVVPAILTLNFKAPTFPPQVVNEM